jgi:DNA-binding transcriptional LysR family regulator
MQLELLKTFCDLVETASFSKAAELNSITQSAVSQQIRWLEKRYKVVLIERGRKNFSLTREGEVLHEAAREILEIHAGIENRIRELRNEVAGELRIATIFSIGLHELPPYMKKFRKQHPDVQLHVEYERSTQVYNRVLEGSVDFGLVAYPRKRKGIIIDALWHDELVLICPPSHALVTNAKPVELRQLEGENFISFEPDLPTRKAIDTMLREARVNIRQTLEFDNIETVKRAVEIESGISIVPRATVEEEARAGNLKVLELDAPAEFTTRSLGAIRKRTRPKTPAYISFLKLLTADNFGMGQPS